MGKIPVYQRQNLASSAVGTPGVDTSGQQAFNSVAESSASIANSAFKMAAQRQESIDKTEALKKASDYELAAFKTLQAHTQEYSSDPTNKTDILKEKLNGQLNDILETTTSPRVKSMIQEAGIEIMGRSAIKEASWAHDQQASLALTNITSTINNRANELYVAGQSGDLNRFSEVMSSLPSVLETSKGILSPEQMLKLKSDAPKSLVNGFIQGAMDQNPAMAAQLLKDGTFDYFGDEKKGNLVRVLSPEDKEKYVETAQKRIKNLADTAQYNRLVTTLSGQEDLVNDFVDNKLTMAQINSIDDPKARETFTKLYTDANPLNAEQRLDAYGELWTRFNGLKINKEKTKAKASLEELVSFQQEVVDARSKNIITDDEAQQFFKSVSKPQEGQLQKRFREGYKIIDKWLESNGRKGDAMAKGRLMNKFASGQMHDLKTNSPRLPREVAQLAIREFASEDSPSLGLLPATPNSLMKGDGTQIHILPGQSSIKADAKAERKDYVVKQDPVSGIRARVYTDGTYEVIQ